ncbi:MAG: hypothetical protein Greene071421_452 [Parcubacteria group bacterium Greene0714_21]|nr:MAG: hypothetical protein Greene041639_105 [Parcubacteria group bacterium Greene0416_39]TSC98216.1 MAG: hypothetical protein Greene101447_179 [Parcubacteria group bacterium Greene1014_47]TSD04086.1 MAG: hypothetical protein Greene071421_452 [Parcubacteria group bacterium Greene0714_21]
MDIIELLVQKNILSAEKAKEVQDEVKKSSKRAEEVVLGEKLIDEELLFSLKSEALGIPLKTPDVGEVSLKVLELVPEDSAKYYHMVPLFHAGNTLEIGMVYPEDLNAQEALKFLARQGSFSYKAFLIRLSTFENLMKQYRSLKEEMKEALRELEKEIEAEGVQIREGKGVGLQRLVQEAPVTKMVAVILRTAVEGNASDIHIEPAKENVRVRFRFLGELHSSLVLPLRVQQAIVARIKILSSLRIDEMRIPQDGRFSAPVEGRMIDFRVSTFPTALGEKVAIRVLDPATGLKGLDELGLEGANLAKVKAAAQRPYGLILATGPTGSGKTTTLYAILQLLNREGLNIVSLEDPIEYLVAGVNQSQVRPEIGYDFASGLRQILRQDPNIIMVGEVRDKETASLVIHAALTGHIVLSTLHTNNAQGVIPRLVDMGIDTYLIPSTLSVAMSQRLVRRLCEECKEKVVAQKPMQQLIEQELALASLQVKKQAEGLRGKGKEFFVYKARGCKKCASSGYSGRIAIFEVLSMTPELSEIVLNKVSENAIAKEAKRQGMASMRQDGILKALDGLTTLEEIVRVSDEP